MKSNNNPTLDRVLEGLMSRYTERVPDVKRVTDALIEVGAIDSQEDIENDHIAFRTLGVPHLGISSFEKIFIHLGYDRRDYYHFETKKLNAYWYSPPADIYPRIFISELRVDELSQEAQSIIHNYTGGVYSDPVDELDLDRPDDIDAFLHTSLWQTPTIEQYLTLQEESEYAAWVIYNRYYLNHYTISVHNLPERWNTLEKFNSFLEDIGVRLNDSGGKIKVSADGLLLQSASVAGMVEAIFAGGEKRMIPGSYVEFAERRVLPEYKDLSKEEILRIHRREGFETGNADRIFESTYSSQTSK